MTFSWTVTEEQHEERIDRLLVTLVEDVSRTSVQRLIHDGAVKVNGQMIKPNYKVQIDDHIDFAFPKASETVIESEDIPLDIVYEDEDVMVVNKPRGMVVHPAPGHRSGTLVNALLYHCRHLPSMDEHVRPGLVHRIDKDTSGLLMVAKNEFAHAHLSAQLKDKTTERLYKTIVHGVIPHAKGTIDAPIGRDQRDRQKMTVTHVNSKNAVTHFTLDETFAHYSYVSCQLETGRTHQIRVHFAYIGHPVAGDAKYGRKKTLPIDGQALHAEILGFSHPRTGEALRFFAPIPEDMHTLLQQLREKA
ncbi:RluA family pseudouridine synthase [Bacillus sp. FSL W7-1360]